MHRYNAECLDVVLCCNMYGDIVKKSENPVH